MHMFSNVFVLNLRPNAPVPILFRLSFSSIMYMNPISEFAISAGANQTILFSFIKREIVDIIIIVIGN